MLLKKICLYKKVFLTKKPKIMNYKQCEYAWFVDPSWSLIYRYNTSIMVVGSSSRLSNKSIFSINVLTLTLRDKVSTKTFEFASLNCRLNANRTPMKQSQTSTSNSRLGGSSIYNEFITCFRESWIYEILSFYIKVENRL